MMLLPPILDPRETPVSNSTPSLIEEFTFDEELISLLHNKSERAEYRIFRVFYSLNQRPHDSNFSKALRHSLELLASAEISLKQFSDFDCRSKYVLTDQDKYVLTNDDIATIAELHPNIEKFECKNCSQLTSQIGPSLIKMKLLKNLTLHKFNKNDNGLSPYFGQLSELKQLDLTDFPYTDKLGESISQLSKLTFLKLNLVSVYPDEEVFNSRVAKLTNLNYLELTGDFFTDEIITNLFQHPQLDSLHLYSNRLTDNVATLLPNLLALEGLSIKSDLLTDNIGENLAKLSGLRQLSIGGENKITNAIANNIRQLPHLQTITFVKIKNLTNAIMSNIFRPDTTTSYLAPHCFDGFPTPYIIGPLPSVMFVKCPNIISNAYGYNSFSIGY